MPPKAPQPDLKASREFLLRVYPEGPWLLTAISPDRKSISTRTFYPDRPRLLEDWLSEKTPAHNIYWSVNRPRRDMDRKANREDIAKVCYLHVDVDPRAGEDLEEEQKRIFKLMQYPPKGVPRPTFVIFSGGGFQAFWRLIEPIPVDGLEAAERAKLYNLELEHRFGADSCHNIDRICRLPGTINIPDAVKRRKGRKKALATLAIETWDEEWSLKEFRKAAAPIQTSGTILDKPSGKAAVPDAVERLTDVSDLDQWSVPDRVKVIIVQGTHPDEEKEGDSSRSAWLFDALCNMARCKVPDDVMYSVVTDPGFEISASVLDKKSSSRRYALRQIERAKEHAIDPWLRRMNEKHAVVANIGGKCRVMEEVYDEVLDRYKLTFQTFEDVRNRYLNQVVKVGVDKSGEPIYMPVGKWWLLHKERRQYERIAFAPGRELDPTIYNLWQGFAVEPMEGDCGMFLDHTRSIICDGSEERYDYLLGWMARVVQRPGSPGETAIVMRGGQGTGKSFFANEFGRLFGRHHLAVSNPGHLVGDFNVHLRDCVSLFGDEAFFAGDKRHESVLKTLITESMFMIQPKFVDAEPYANYVHLMMASNSDWVVPAGADERRFLVLDVNSNRQKDTTYFGELRRVMDEGGRAALLHHLMHHDISGFQVRDAPLTKALMDQKSLSLNPLQQWWYERITGHRDLIDGSEEYVFNSFVPKWRLHEQYLRDMQKWNVPRRLNAVWFSRELTALQPMKSIYRNIANRDRTSTQRTHCFEVPPRSECVETWTGHFGFTEEEPEPIEGNNGTDDDRPF